MIEDPFTLEIRAIVKKYYPNNMGHKIEVDLPTGAVSTLYI